MATEAATEGKVYDLTKGEWITPEVKKEEVKEEKKEEAPKEEKKEEPPKTEEKKEETKTEEEVTPDFTSHLKEKYGIESEDELKKILDTNVKLTEELEAEKKAVKEPKYKSDKHKKLMEWMDGSGYDVDKIGEGLETAATLINLDVAKMDGRRALEEAFILDNTDITREEAKKLFAKEFKQYTIKKEDFEDDKEFAEAQELADIQRKKDEAKARKTLSSEQEKLKFVEKPKEEKKEEKFEVPKETIDGYTSQIDKIFDDGKGNKFDRFIFEDEKDPTIKFSIVIPPEKLKDIQATARAYVQRVDNYDANKKITNFDPVKTLKQITDALYGDWKDEEMFKQVVTLAKTLRAEQLAGVKPDKESKSGGKGDGVPSITEQFAEHAKKEKEAREKARIR